MNQRAMLWGAIVALMLPILVGGWVAFRSDNEGLGQLSGVQGVTSVPGLAAPVDSLAGRAREVAPFRLDGKPSRVAYDPVRSEAPGDQYRPPMPVLTLTGLLGGSRPMVVLGGLPGRDGAVLLGVGDTAAGLKVQRIKEGRVTITGLDTMWLLTVRGTP